MPPKPKKLSPKQLIALLEAELAALKLEKAATEQSLLDTNRRLATELGEMKAALVSLQREKGALSDIRERELRAELVELRAAKKRLEHVAANAARDAASVAALEAERLILLRQAQEAAAASALAGRTHAKEMADLQTQLSGLKMRLESTFADTLRTAVADEKRRLQLALDADAQSALADVGALRAQSAAQARQIAQLVRVAEDRLKESDANAARAARAEERTLQADRKLQQQAPHAQAQLLEYRAAMELAKKDAADARKREAELEDRLHSVVAEARSALHLSAAAAVPGSGLAHGPLPHPLSSAAARARASPSASPGASPLRPSSPQTFALSPQLATPAASSPNGASPLRQGPLRHAARPSSAGPSARRLGEDESKERKDDDDASTGDADYDALFGRGAGGAMTQASRPLSTAARSGSPPSLAPIPTLPPASAVEVVRQRPQSAQARFGAANEVSHAMGRTLPTIVEAATPRATPARPTSALAPRAREEGPQRAPIQRGGTFGLGLTVVKLTVR